MKAVLFYNDGFAQFEIALVLLNLPDLEWHHVALENRPYRSLEGQTFLVSHTLESIDPKSVDLFLIPGGDSLPLFEMAYLKTFIERCISSGGLVAGICGGSELLAGFGLLDGLRCTGGASGIRASDPLAKYYQHTKYEASPVVVDNCESGIMITAQGLAYEAFASKLVEVMNDRLAGTQADS